MKKRILSMIIAIVMVTGLIPATAFAVSAEGEAVTPGDITSGSWTPMEPDDASVATTGEWTASGNYDIDWYDANSTTKTVTITTAQQLAGLSVLTNGLNNETKKDFEGWTFTLGNDIDISGKTWTPISYKSDTVAFNGTFDGKDFTVKGLTIKAAAAYTGLFGYTQEKSTIKNVKMSDVYINISGGYSAGAVTGFTLGSVENCHVLSGELTKTGVARKYNGFGGVIGELGEAATVKDCSNAATVYYVLSDSTDSNYSYIGGVIGCTKGTTEGTTVTISNCQNTGKVLAVGGENMGGIIGSSRGGTIENCVNSGLVTGPVTNIGGIAGRGANTHFKNCQNTANVNNEEKTPTFQVQMALNYGVGGIVGDFVETLEMSSAKALVSKIENCSNSGTISGKGNYNCVGGLVGVVWNQWDKNAKTEITGSKNTGLVIGATSADSVNNYAGGLVGNIAYTSGSEVKTLTVTISDCSNTNAVTGYTAGGLVGGSVSSRGSKVVTKVNGSYNTGNVAAQNGAGGIIGTVVEYVDLNVADCYNVGNVSAAVSSAGGLVGIIGAGYTDTKKLGTNFANCYNTGTVTSALKLGGINGEYSTSYTTSTYANTYYLDSCVTSGAASGSTTSAITGITSKDATAFEYGEVAYLLQNNGTTQIWGQTVKTDALPVLSSSEDKKVVKVTVLDVNDSSNIIGAVYATTKNIAYNYPKPDTGMFLFYEDSGKVNAIDKATKTYTADMNIYAETSDKTEIVITLEATDKTYNGEAYAGLATPVFSNNYQGEYTITYSGTLADGTTYSSTTNAPTDAGEYTVTVSVPKNDGENIVASSASADFKITPKALENPETPVIADISEGTALSTVELPDGWQWKDVNTVLKIGENNVTVVYPVSANYDASGIDGYNETYKQIERTVTLTVIAKSISVESYGTVSFGFTGSAIEVSPVIKNNTTALIKDTDYTITYYSVDSDGKISAKLNAAPTYNGNYVYVITLIGNYAGDTFADGSGSGTTPSVTVGTTLASDITSQTAACAFTIGSGSGKDFTKDIEDLQAQINELKEQMEDKADAETVNQKLNELLSKIEALEEVKDDYKDADTTLKAEF